MKTESRYKKKLTAESCFHLHKILDSVRETKESDLSPRDFNAFLDVVTELKPNIIIVWGCVVNTPIKNNKYLIDKEELIKTDGYVCHLSIPNIKHKICIINPYHPSSIRFWYNNLKTFQDHLSEQLML